jgi:hypothetical protein
METGDGRGEVLRRAAEGGHFSSDRYPNGYAASTTNSGMSNRYGTFSHQLSVSLLKPLSAEHKEPRFSASIWEIGHPIHNYIVPVPHNEARQIADGLPNSADVHRFLDEHHGPDPRPKYDHEIDAGLKTSGEGER